MTAYLFEVKGKKNYFFLLLPGCFPQIWSHITLIFLMCIYTCKFDHYVIPNNFISKHYWRYNIVLNYFIYELRVLLIFRIDYSVLTLNLPMI